MLHFLDSVAIGPDTVQCELFNTTFYQVGALPTASYLQVNIQIIQSVTIVRGFIWFQLRLIFHVGTMYSFCR